MAVIGHPSNPQVTKSAVYVQSQSSTISRWPVKFTATLTIGAVSIEQMVRVPQAIEVSV